MHNDVLLDSSGNSISVLMDEERKVCEPMVFHIPDSPGHKSLYLQVCEGERGKMENDLAKFSEFAETIQNQKECGKLLNLTNIRICFFCWGHRYKIRILKILSQWETDAQSVIQNVEKACGVKDAVPLIEKMYLDLNDQAEMDFFSEEDAFLKDQLSLWMEQFRPQYEELSKKAGLSVEILTDVPSTQEFRFWYRELLNVYRKHTRDGVDIESEEFRKAYAQSESVLDSAVKERFRAHSLVSFYSLTPKKDPQKLVSRAYKAARQALEKWVSQTLSEDAKKLFQERKGLYLFMLDMCGLYQVANLVHVGNAFVLGPMPCDVSIIFYPDAPAQRYLIQRINESRKAKLCSQIEEGGRNQGEVHGEIKWIYPAIQEHRGACKESPNKSLFSSFPTQKSFSSSPSSTSSSPSLSGSSLGIGGPVKTTKGALLLLDPFSLDFNSKIAGSNLTRYSVERAWKLWRDAIQKGNILLEKWRYLFSVLKKPLETSLLRTDSSELIAETGMRVVASPVRNRSAVDLSPIPSSDLERLSRLISDMEKFHHRARRYGLGDMIKPSVQGVQGILWGEQDRVSRAHDLILPDSLVSSLSKGGGLSSKGDRRS